MTAVIFGFTVFCGWLIFDFAKEKQLRKELVMSSFIVGTIAGVGWWLLGYLFN
ncbi:hypothetical protein [Alkalihalobacillus trypoxylicola]|uniref:hypothetical protein n=1 Tax=Alkalihalobacillus trypoxylicola TaxID=519424 RepID=UPI0004315385|nr:hypothetical protein [Alkalihalobacillus trypoxylicola]GAF64862.1 hypothetical protein BTS2_1758 [Bacillus sp. TS-2]